MEASHTDATANRSVPRLYLWAVGIWTLLAAAYVFIDSGWGAVIVMGGLSVILNAVVAVVGAILVLVRAAHTKRLRWQDLAIAVFVPAASEAVIFGAFVAARP